MILMDDEEDDSKRPTGICPVCRVRIVLLAPDDLRAHIQTTTGEFCPGSRGEPDESP